MVCENKKLFCGPSEVKLSSFERQNYVIYIIFQIWKGQCHSLGKISLKLGKNFKAGIFSTYSI